MNFLQNVLPGVREVRTPLTAGYLILISGWLLWWLGSQPNTPNTFSGIADIINDGSASIGVTSVLIVTSAAAYLIGVALQTLAENLLIPGFVFSIRIIWMALLAPVALLMVIFGRFPASLTRFNEANGQFTEQLLNSAELSRYNEFKLARPYRFIAPESEIAPRRYHFRLAYRNVQKAISEALQPQSSTLRMRKEEFVLRFMRTHIDTGESLTTVLERISWRDVLDVCDVDDAVLWRRDINVSVGGEFEEAAPVAARNMARAMVEISRTDSYTREVLIPRLFVGSLGVDQALDRELASLPIRLQDEKASIYADWNRSKSEAEFRVTVGVAVMFFACCAVGTMVVSQLTALLLGGIALLLVIDGMSKQSQAELDLLSILQAGRLARIEVSPELLFFPDSRIRLSDALNKETPKALDPLPAPERKTESEQLSD